MNTDHINHNTSITIPKVLKKINPNYTAAHFGKWGMGIVRPKQGFNFGVHPSVLGYDFSDGQTTNFDGGFKQNEWTYSTSDDPKKIFSLTEKSISFIEKQVQAKKPFYLQLSHYAVHTNITSRNKTLEKYKNLKKGELHKNPNFAALTEDLDTSFGMILKKVKDRAFLKFSFCPNSTSMRIRSPMLILPPTPLHEPNLLQVLQSQRNKLQNIQTSKWTQKNR